MSTLYTFYSYKGGVGRSMAMANVAALLSKWGHSVLVIDWDLEAPGLEKYFMTEPSIVEGSRAEKPGVVDIVTAFAKGERLDWEKCLLRAYPFGRDSRPVDILGAGQETSEYVSRLQDIDWRRLFEEGFGAYLEEMRDAWLGKYDFVLVDSRTGITDIGGVCTIHLPDVLVLLFTANEQSLQGVIDVMRSAQEKFARLPEEYGRRKRRVGPDEHLERRLVGVPVPSRFEDSTEFKNAERWLKKFGERLKHIYADWLPRGTAPEDIPKQLIIPYIPFWSFGENLPVVEEKKPNPRSISFAYDRLARLLERDLQWRVEARSETEARELTPEQVDEEAEQIYSGLGADDLKIARRVLSNLVLIAPEGRGEDSRRRPPRSEFDDPSWHLVQTLAEAKLLTVVPGEVSGEDVVEIAQDATLRHWKRLKKWLAEDSDFLLWRQHLRAGMAAWKKVERDPAYLLNGSALTTAEQFVSKRGDELSEHEKRYVEQSRAFEARLKRDARLKRAAGLAALFIVAFVGVFYTYRAYTAQQRAQEQTRLYNLAVQQTARGVDLSEQEHFEEAIAAYNEALGYKDDYPLAYYSRGEAQLNLANVPSNSAHKDALTALAISDLNKALDLGLEADMQNRARQLLDQARHPETPFYGLTPTPTPTLRVTPTPRPSVTPTASPQPTPVASPTPILAVNITPRVYIQSLPEAATFAAACGARLQKVGYTVPPISRVTSVPQTTEVRFYRKSDAKDAEQLVSLLKSWGVANAATKYLGGFESSTAVRPRHFEIWLSKEGMPATGSAK